MTKLQNSIEYIMMWGFALLVILIVVIALIENGFLGSTPVSTTCDALVGFKCQNLIYSSTTGNVVATITQDEQITWATTNMIIVVQGSDTNGIPPSYFVSGNEDMVGSMATNQPAYVSLPMLSSSGNPVGAVNKGFAENAEIWVQYTTPGTSQYYYVMIAKVVAKAA